MNALADPGQRKGGSWSTPLLLLSFALVFLVLFNADLREATGEWVGVVLDPIIWFNGAYPVLTIFLASVVLVIATTTIRHFLVDWTMMARTQEVMRKFQKEFSEARKSNNTYKIKKLTEAQPKVFELQAGLQKDQLKPMAFTMLIVIPLFAWLGHHLIQPVGFELVEAPDEPFLVVATRGLGAADAFVAGPEALGQEVLVSSTDLYGYAFVPPGREAPAAGAAPIVLENGNTQTNFAVPVEGAPVVPEAARVGELAAGTYTFDLVATSEGEPLVLTGEHGPWQADRAVLVFVQDGRLAQALAVGGDAAQVTLDADSVVYAIVPDGLAGGEADGQIAVEVAGAATAAWTIGPANVVELDVPESSAPIYPHVAELPWQDPWSLQDLWWFLPHWILLYSLFGIPFGQIAQRALKLWEYRHVDLDGDGRQAGEA